jgi:hypothetical protein
VRHHARVVECLPYISLFLGRFSFTLVERGLFLCHWLFSVTTMHFGLHCDGVSFDMGNLTIVKLLACLGVLWRRYIVSYSHEKCLWLLMAKRVSALLVGVQWIRDSWTSLNGHLSIKDTNLQSQLYDHFNSIWPLITTPPNKATAILSPMMSFNREAKDGDQGP